MSRRGALLGTGAGLVVGALAGAGIFWVPAEPRPLAVFLAATLKGGITGLLIAATLEGITGWMETLVGGAALGSLVGLVVALAKGFSAAPYVLPASLLEGVLLALIIRQWSVSERRKRGERP